MIGPGNRMVRLLLSCLLVSTAVSARAQDAPYDVHVVFIGMMMFEPQAGKATVVVPNLKAGLTQVGEDKHDVHAHVPYILGDKKTFPAGAKLNQNHEFIKAKHHGRIYQYVLLQGEQISLDDTNRVVELNRDPLKFNKNEGDGRCPTKDGDADKDTTTSLYWLSSIARVKGAAQNKSLPYFDKLPENELISARANLLFGSLEARVISPGVLWNFTTLDGADKVVHTQALAQEVHWKFQASGEPFILNLLGFDGNSRRLAFTPQGGKVVIVVGNTTADDTGALPDAGNPPLKDVHYSAYYQAIAGNEDNALGPIPIPQKDDRQWCKVVWDPTLRPSGPVIDDEAEYTILTAKAKKPAVRSTASGHGMTGGEPSPGGLNCSSSQWP